MHGSSILSILAFVQYDNWQLSFNWKPVNKGLINAYLQLVDIVLYLRLKLYYILFPQNSETT